jgi:hypothetical protein
VLGAGSGNRVAQNLIVDNGGGGVVVSRDSTNALVAHNIIDGNSSFGVLFADRNHPHDNRNVVRNNVISNTGYGSYSFADFNVQSGTEQSKLPDEGNLLVHNCLYHKGRKQGGVAAHNGFVARDNIVANPDYIISGGKYRLAKRSRCRAVLADDGSNIGFSSTA